MNLFYSHFEFKIFHFSPNSLKVLSVVLVFIHSYVPSMLVSTSEMIFFLSHSSLSYLISNSSSCCFKDLYHFLNNVNLILKYKVVVLICSVGLSFWLLLLSVEILFCSLSFSLLFITILHRI